MEKTNPVGVFDSGLGGLSVVHTLKKLMPEEDILFFGDSIHNPYGTKTREQITDYSIGICRMLEEKGAKAIVIACNTATSACVRQLREMFDMDIIGMEPALKPAATIGSHQRIAVWATKLTLEEEKFARLMSRFQKDHEILKVPCMKLVALVENDQLENQEAVDEVLKEYLDQSNWETLDSIVLGCTHFVFFRQRLEELTEGRVRIIDGNEGTARHVKELLDNKNLLNDSGGKIEVSNSLEDRIGLSYKLLQLLEDRDESQKCMAELL
ncbi:MAG: glutamate racemase [Erysipelotrichaceae bacterium]|nr:glutamate racemase [Erysipelotrichaceae bacterium]